MQERPRMPDGQLIEFDHVTKRFGAVAAVSDLSARVNPGVVTGFLGPNGAGKTTTLRMLLGLERPTIGTTKIGGKRFSELRNPARVIGAMLEDPGFRARRTVERHLIAAAKANGIDLSRVGELISFVGLGDDVDTRIAALSLGMRQRLSAATALIGDPGVLVLDEPANGLDPEGIRWMRTLIRGLADEGRTVLVSSHVLSEVEQIADEILVIAHGELKFAGTMEDLADPSNGPVVVDAADRPALSNALRAAGFEFEILRSGLTVRGSDAATIGGITASAGVALTTLQQRGPTLEDVFLDLVNDRYVRPAATEPASAEDVSASSEPVAEPGPRGPEAPGSAERRLEGGVRIEASGTDAAAENVADPSTSSGSGDSHVTEPAAEPSEADVVSEPEPRPLPGIAGLAEVASLFAPRGDAADDADAPDDADAADDAAPDRDDDASAHDDLDATRVINTVPGDEANTTDRLFSSVTPEDSPVEDSPEHDIAEHESAESEASDGEAAGDAESGESDSAHEQH